MTQLADMAKTRISPLDGRTVHIWTLPLDAEADRPRIRARVESSLRRILARYVDLDPASLPLHRTRLGRPFVADSDEHGIQLSLSHSESLGLVAITRGHPVGIDLERLRSLRDPARLASRFFTDEEAAFVLAQDTADSLERFFYVWVRKEAYVKTCEGAVPRDMKRFAIHVSQGDSEGNAVRWSKLEPGPEAWSILSVALPSSYVGAVAVHRDVSRVECFSYGDEVNQ